MSKRTSGLVILTVLALALFMALTAFAENQGGAKATPAKAADAKATTAESGKTTYLIVSPHTKAECLAALDALAAKGEATLAQYDFGCMSGDHTCYLKTQAASEQEALASVPEALRAKAKAVKLTKFTVAQVKAMHSQSESH